MYPAGKTWKDSFAKLVKLFVDMRNSNQNPNVLYEIGLKYYQPIFERLYSDDYPKRQKDLDQLKSIIDGYEQLQSFIDDTTLDPPDDGGKDGPGIDKLILSTIHSSKGLEFEAVFVIGMADGRFPHGSAVFSEQWEEERRLFYVASTRAKKYLYLTYPRQLMTQDRQFRRVGMSPFLNELSGGLFERAVEKPVKDLNFFNAQPNPISSPPKKKKLKKLEMSDFKVGGKVNHPFFGDGAVTKLSKGRSLDIHFDRHGLKTLHLDYAKLTIL